jgi:MGT family glycosyltransferase
LRPLAYCSLGTYSRAYRHHLRLFRVVVEAFRRLPGWQLLVQTGGVERAQLPPLPDNVVLSTGSVPQLQVLELASLVIAHGGFSIVKEAVFYGTPMILSPGWYDQPGNAARVVFHHLGVRGDMATVDPESLLGLIRQVSEDSTYQRAVTRMQQIFQAQADCAQGATVIERILMASS